MQDSSTNAEGFHLVGLYCVALRKWQFRYAVSFGEASASESQLQCSSVAQSKAEHVETAVPGSTGMPFRILSDCQILGVFWETRHQVMARVAVLAVLMMQALADQACQEEACQEESSTLMQINHRDLDQT